jgi:ABC-type glycerol-3-phosphate transport system substrate-binding protein
VAFIAVLLTCIDTAVALAAQARWEDVVRAAEKEGEVSVYATNSVGELTVIWDAFKKKYPKIKLSAVPISTTSEIVTKIMAERRASQYYPDVVLGAPGATYNSLHRGKTLDPLAPALILPEVTDPSKWWKGNTDTSIPKGNMCSSTRAPSMGHRFITTPNCSTSIRSNPCGIFSTQNGRAR